MPVSENLCNRVLIRRCADGDEAALRALYQRHQGMVYSLLFRMLGSRDDADELLPEVFLKIWNGAGRFQSRADPVTWIYRIASNTCIDRLRRRPVAISVSWEELGDSAEAAAVPYDPDRSLLLAEQQQRLQAGLMALPPEERLLITLYHIEDRSYEEIQAITGMSYKLLKSRLFRARQRLRTQYQRDECEANEDDVPPDTAPVARFQWRPA